MGDEDLIDLLQRKEEAAGSYVWGQLGTERENALREYYRLPYGNEEDGWSQIVTSDIQDTVEWVLPALLKTFSSTDKAVSFEPSRPEDVLPAEQATDACNYVFYKQNNGFLVLYNAFKDALTVRNCAVMWRKETQEVVSSIPFKQATPEMLAMLTQDGSEIQEANPEQVVDPATGMPIEVFSGRMKKVEEKTSIKVEAFSPEDLLIDRTWTSPLLADCPYVCRMMRVTISDLKMMGFDVLPSELDDADGSDRSADATMRLSKVNQTDNSYDQSNEQTDDDSMREGWLRIEFVLVDVDGDGIAERRCIYRLRDKILKNEVCTHVPVATFSPILNTHRWDGMSMADVVSDLQKLHTELMRQTLNSLYLSNNPRTKVLTDANWSPLANIDDLLDSRPGGVIRQRDPNAVVEHITPFAAAGAMPMLEYIKGMREDRTGVSRTSMGLNPDSLNNTATGRQLDMTATMQRVELIARIAAETLLKPIFSGILKLLTDGGMEKLAFRLRNEFVEYDPNEWRDSYDMTINVGLGTGDTQSKAAQLMLIAQLQEKGMAIGLATPKHLYNTGAKIIENAGFKDVQNFIQDPTTAPPMPPRQDPLVQIEQMKIQADGQKHQAQIQQDQLKAQAESQMTMQLEQMKAEMKLKEIQASLELQAANDARDAEREQNKAIMDAQLAQQQIEFERWQAELQAQTQIYLKQMELGAAQPLQDGGDINNALAVSIEGFRAALEQMNKPKQVVRDQNGKAVGIAPV